MLLSSPKTSFKKSKLSIALDQQSDVSYSLLAFNVQDEDYRILKLAC